MTTVPSALPTVLQGGMGVAVSGWRLAREVSRLGQLGVVSGTGIDTVLVRRLQDGDPGGHMRRAMSRFPVADVAEAILDRYFIPGGRPPGTPYRRLPLLTVAGDRLQRGALALGAFVEVALAKEGHGRPVGINLLAKIELATLPTLYGAMLAGVDVVLMGAGIPLEIPGALDRLARGERATLRVGGGASGRLCASASPARGAETRRSKPRSTRPSSRDRTRLQRRAPRSFRSSPRTLSRRS